MRNNSKGCSLPIVLVFMILVMSFGSCTDDVEFVIDGKTVVAESYGLANKDSKMIEGVVYEVSLGNVVWSILLSETIIAPVYFVGWDIMQPVRLEGK